VGTRDKKGKFTAVRSVVDAWGGQGDSGPVNLQGLWDDVVEAHERLLETIRPDTTAPNREADQGLHYDMFPDRTLLRIKISSSLASPGCPRTHRKVPVLPTSQVQSSGVTIFLSRPWLPHVIHISIIPRNLLIFFYSFNFSINDRISEVVLLIISSLSSMGVCT
jgi:hypothetical protein